MRHFLPIFVKIGWVVYGLILLTDMQTDASEKNNLLDGGNNIMAI